MKAFEKKVNKKLEHSFDKTKNWFNLWRQFRKINEDNRVNGRTYNGKRIN